MSSHGVNAQRCVGRVKVAGAWAQCPAPADPATPRGWYCLTHEPIVPKVPTPRRRRHPRLTRALAWAWALVATVGAWLLAYGLLSALADREDPYILGGLAYLTAGCVFALTRPNRGSHRVNQIPDRMTAGRR